MCKWVLVAEGPDVFIGLPCSWSPRQLWATAHCGCSGNQAWGPLQDQYEFITTELSFSSPPRSLCTVYGVRVSPGSPGWSVTSVPQLQEMLLPLPAKFWVCACATFLFFFLFFFFPFFFPPSSFLLPPLPNAFFWSPWMPWHLLCRWGWPNLPTQIHLPRITGVGHHTQAFFLKRFIFDCVCACIIWVLVVSEARREC